MNMLNRFGRLATMCGCALLLCFSLSAAADEVQDITKLFKQGKQEQALKRIDAYLVEKPKDAQARFLKGLILTDQNKTDDAIKIFSGLTEDFPELPEPYNNLAVLYASKGQYDKARIALEMAIRTHPSYATAHENLGDIYAKMASQAYDRALQLDHTNNSTKTKLAMIREIFSTGAGRGEKPEKTKPVAAAPATTVASAQTETAAPHQEAAAAAAEPAAAPSKSSKPAKPTHKTKASHSSKDVIKRVHAWAAAWSSKNVKSYLAFYAEDFSTPDKLSRANWEAQRRERISRPKYIKIGVSDVKVEFFDDDHVSVSFHQSYRAPRLHNTTRKTLAFENVDGQWLIQEERTGP